MRFSAHPERQTTFEQVASQLGLSHHTCQPGAPWQNGVVKRSHRTDNEELFDVLGFASSEERRYRLRLWEYEYNGSRPHQGLGGRTPMQVYREWYGWHAISRMLM